MMTHYIQEEEYVKAVKLLCNVVGHHTFKKKQKPPERVIELFYKFSPTLMEHAPKVTVDAWMAMRNYLGEQQKNQKNQKIKKSEHFWIINHSPVVIIRCNSLLLLSFILSFIFVFFFLHA